MRGADTDDMSAAGPVSTRAPVLPPDVPQYFIPPDGNAAGVRYRPTIIGVADVTYGNVKYNIAEQRRVVLMATVNSGPIAMDWGTAERVAIDISAMEGSARPNAAFADLPKLASSPKSYAVWGRALQKWIATNETVTLYRSQSTKQTSQPGESERDFRIRLQLASREARDAGIEKLRGKYAAKLGALQERIRKAEQAVVREQSEASQAKTDTFISVGSAILGAMFSRGKVGSGAIGKVGTAARGAGRMARQSGDVTRAGETVQALATQYHALESELQGELDALGASFNSQTEELETVVVKARAGDVVVPLVALAWVPV